MQEDSRIDLTCLLNTLGQPPTEDSITNLLSARFKRNQPYTRIGHLNLIVVNPYQPLEILNDVTLRSYADVGYRNLIENKQFMQPHVYDLAARVYFHMRRTGEDQSIILRYVGGCELVYLEGG